MTRFQAEDVVYTKDGRKYYVDLVEDGIVFCSTANGAEADFHPDQLLTEAEWEAEQATRHRSAIPLPNGFRSPAPRPGDIKRCERVIAEVNRLLPDLLGYTAFRVADTILREQSGEGVGVGETKAVIAAFNQTVPPVEQVNLLAAVIGATPDVLIGMLEMSDQEKRQVLGFGALNIGGDFALFRLRLGFSDENPLAG
jgi:hypothetical protein